jgi:tetratricopeptide (TPR) repeat protein
MPMIQQFLQGDPAAADWNFMMGESLWRTQQAEKALPYLERALNSNPKMLPAHAALGLALVSLGRNSEAIPHLESAVSLDDDGSLHYSLARAYQATGDKERARASMEQYTQIKKRNAEVNGELAKEAEITAPATPAPGR